MTVLVAEDVEDWDEQTLVEDGVDCRPVEDEEGQRVSEDAVKLALELGLVPVSDPEVQVQREVNHRELRLVDQSAAELEPKEEQDQVVPKELSLNWVAVRFLGMVGEAEDKEVETGSREA